MKEYYTEKTFDEVEDMIKRANSGTDKEAEKEYEIYDADEARLEMTIQHNYETANGKIEDTE
eukprot:3877610-Amphidinium_carterae.1